MAATSEKIIVTLTPEMSASLHRAVESGEYDSSLDIVEDALWEWTQKRKEQPAIHASLRELWQEARADKRPGLDPDKVFDDLERKFSRP